MGVKMALKRLPSRKKGIMGATKRREPIRFMTGLTKTNAPTINLVELHRASLGPTGKQDTGNRDF